MGPGTSIFNCPTNTPTSNTLVTVPKLNFPMRSLPSQNPRNRVRNMASSGRSLSWFIIHSIIKLFRLLIGFRCFWRRLRHIQQPAKGSVLCKSGFLEHLFSKTGLSKKVFLRTFASTFANSAQSAELSDELQATGYKFLSV